ncbi:MAG: hypothetical protein U5L09_03070 [Bacteroidales bacterium]|nr:hypothetical protein [Bacteroidales bacterium]
MTLTIEQTPTVNAGENSTICESENVTLNGSATNYEPGSVLWGSTGDGIFSDASSLITVYTPGTSDIIDGSIQLFLSVDGVSACEDSYTDSKTLTIINSPSVNAGSNLASCLGESVFINANASNYSSLAWTTSGTGTFDNNASTNTIYNPSAQDINNGFVVLTLTANGYAPCDEPVSDQALLSIHSEAEADAGNDQEICESEVLTISEATADNYSMINWTTSGMVYFQMHQF